MSIKLYDAYSLPKLSHEELMEFLKSVGEKIRAEHVILYSKIFAETAASIIDRYACGVRPKKDGNTKSETCNPYSFVLSRIYEAGVESKVKKIRNPLYDFECCALVVPCDEKHLALLFTDQRSFRKIFEDEDQVKSYPYWNNVDPPEDVPHEEWAARGKEWEEALGEGPMMYNGYSYEFTTDISFSVLIEDIISQSPSLEERVKTVAVDLLCGDFSNNNPELEVAKVFFKYRDWLQTDEGKADLDTKKTWVEEQIEHALTKEDYYEEIPWAHV